jgi:hypothetical protein
MQHATQQRNRAASRRRPPPMPWRTARRRERVTSFGVISLNSIAYLSCRGEIIPSHRCRTAAAAPPASKPRNSPPWADGGILATGGLSAFSSCGHGVEDAGVGDGPNPDSCSTATDGDQINSRFLAAALAVILCQLGPFQQICGAE